MTYIAFQVKALAQRHSPCLARGIFEGVQVFLLLFMLCVLQQEHYHVIWIDMRESPTIITVCECNAHGSIRK